LGGTRPRLRALAKELARRYPKLEAPAASIEAGLVVVDGFVITNPSSLVRIDASISFRRDEPLRGELKLRAALARFDVPVQGRIAMDLGAAAGGFTRALLEGGATRVYAVDAGHGQLLGSLRLDDRVVNLERTNLGLLNTQLVPDAIDLLTLDLSYLDVTRAVTQLSRLRFRRGSDVLALVKPMFELGLAHPPREGPRLDEAVGHAAAGLTAERWNVLGTMECPVRGTRGAIEFFIHARRE
jgi:23S rRNA (cytidine1920-2'-O)/16S rRNA (cytidine1409-2'-O)-methyltransferase